MIFARRCLYQYRYIQAQTCTVFTYILRKRCTGAGARNSRPALRRRKGKEIKKERAGKLLAEDTEFPERRG